MFSNIRSFLVDFITSDVKNESETKTLAVLLRVLSMLFSSYYLLLSIVIASQGFYLLSLILIFFIGILVGSFICTYENKTYVAMWLFNIVLLSCSAFLSLRVYFSTGYHWIAYITIFLVFYEYNHSIKSKLFYSIFIAFYMITVSILSITNPILKSPIIDMQYFVVVINVIVLITSMTSIAYFYRAKFTDSEYKVIQYNKKLLQMASSDSLTQLPNRRTMNEHLKDLVFNNSRSGDPFCIAIADVDFFKHINDQYGHDTGDYVLCELAISFQNYMHGKGMVARWGGEEFLFTFENLHLGQAVYELTQFCKAISEYEFSFKGNSFHITLTFGIEEYQEHLGVEGAISRADSKLYYGKANGRNQVVNYIPIDYQSKI